MTTAAADLLAAALKLSPEDREELVGELWDSLDPPESDIDRMTDEEFEAELNRRREESRRDPSVMIPWEEVQRQLQEEFGDAGHRPPARPG
jgi:putative addiction module component (TIGR02574 family)